MMRFLRHLTPIRGGNLRRVLTVTRINSMQEAILALARGENLVAGRGLVKHPAGAAVRLDARQKTGFGGEGGEAVRECPFGEVLSWTDDSDSGSDSDGVSKRGVRGGFIEAGATQWYEPNHEVAATPEREVLLWIQFEITVNSTPLGEASLSGVLNADVESVQWLEGDVSDSMPDKVVPKMFASQGNVTDGLVVVPIGVLRVSAGGEITLEAAGCGGITVGHCPGNLTITRGG